MLDDVSPQMSGQLVLNISLLIEPMRWKLLMSTKIVSYRLLLATAAEKQPQLP